MAKMTYGEQLRHPNWQMGEARSLLSGFCHGNLEHDPAAIEEARQQDPYIFALGFVTKLANGLSIYELQKVAEFALTMHKAGSDAHPIYDKGRYLFGGGG